MKIVFLLVVSSHPIDVCLTVKYIYISVSHQSVVLCYYYYSDALVIQEANTSYPRANSSGGKLTFTFDAPVLLIDIGLIDMEESNSQVILTYQSGAKETVYYSGLGENSVMRLILNKLKVMKLEVVFTGVAAISEINICPSCSL